MKLQSPDPGDVRIFSGSSHPSLAGGVAAYLNVPLSETRISRFSNDNLYIQLKDSVRARSVYLIQSLCPPVNDHLMELLMMTDIARGASAREIHAIVPYFSFARSDKKDAPRISITARLVADLLQSAGATHIMTMMLHSPQVHGFFSLPTDPLSSMPAFVQYFQGQALSNTVVVAADMGIVKLAARFAKLLQLPIAAGNKERISDTQVRLTGIVGTDLKQYRRALIYDDEIATGGTMAEMANALLKEGIAEVWVVCTHGVFVRGGLQKLLDIPAIQKIVTTDTIPTPSADRIDRLTVLTVAPVFGEAILRNYRKQSIGDLFVYGEDGR
jgi:ribose-phosphate pyrophosphokinase